MADKFKHFNAAENFSRQKSKNLQFVGLLLESYSYQEIKFNSW